MHTKEVVAIKIGFENCECTEKLTVPTFDLFSSGADVYSISLENVHIDIFSCANNTKGRYVCDKTRIVLNPKALKKSGGEGMFSDYKLFERICNGNDITDIQIFFSDKSHETIFVPWKYGKTQYQNLLMKTDRIEDGKLEIVIEEKKVK